MNETSEDRLAAIAGKLLQPTSVGGVVGRTGLFEQVIDGVMSLITSHRAPGTEIFHFPPVMSRALLEKSGYLKSFPHLLGCVSCLDGTEAQIRALVEGRDSSRNWTEALVPSELVLTPAACYPVYPIVSARGPVSPEGVIVDVSSYCFRHEASAELGRLQAFRMREYVCIGGPEAVQAFRKRWVALAEEIVQQLAVPYKLAPASDPFFGRAGKLMAINQVEQALKYEMLIPVNSEEDPTACMSFNYHQDHFGTTWGLATPDGNVAHTACSAFGIDRLGIALFATHGLDLQAWPKSTREALSL